MSFNKSSPVILLPGHAAMRPPKVTVKFSTKFVNFAAVLGMVVTASCVPKQDRPAPPVPQPPPTAETPAPAPAPAKPPTAALLGVSPGPAMPALGEAEAARALEAFRISCPALVKRTDASGLTRPEDWQGACAIAAGRPGFRLRFLR